MYYIQNEKITRSGFRKNISAAYLQDEAQCINARMEYLNLQAHDKNKISRDTENLINSIRNTKEKPGGIETFVKSYDLSTEEGILLMCLAEALLRIPDSKTADRLIKDKLGQANWTKHLGEHSSLFVNAATWGLMLTSKFVTLDNVEDNIIPITINRIITRSGLAFVRKALREAMRLMGYQFVMGQTIEEAINRSQGPGAHNPIYSYDMLGEEAITRKDVDYFFQLYQHAIEAIAFHSKNNVYDAPGISVKLSALHPRFEYLQRQRVMQELLPRLQLLCQLAANANIQITIDAEESDRLELTLDIFETLYTDITGDWQGLGLAVQAYQKRAMPVIEWLDDLSTKHKRVIPVRLVKGAYWDTEIKRTQLRGLSGYPVFTRKSATDVSYLACVQKLLTSSKLYPMFATHNAHTVCAVIEYARHINTDKKFEFQRLHGMGKILYDSLEQQYADIYPCRIYAPVGQQKELLPYLIRRLLENGANTSFVNRLEDPDISVNQLATDPINLLLSFASFSHPDIILPKDLYQPQRDNSCGILLSDPVTLHKFSEQLKVAATNIKKNYRTDPSHKWLEVNPEYSPKATRQSLETLNLAVNRWQNIPLDKRIAILWKAAQLFKKSQAQFVELLVREGGKCIPDAITEVRETIDYCYYYAGQAQLHLKQRSLGSATGEKNEYEYHSRGLIACISPWNFPLAIFCGQVLAALVSGNVVIAKAAHATPIVAYAACQLLYEAGVPEEALHLVTASSKSMGDHILTHPAIRGVVFTGSVATARHINIVLAKRDGPITPLIAETGGINCMIVDSSALPQQTIRDIVFSAFNSAGQRCSALRVLYLQNEIAEEMIQLLKGAMAELTIGSANEFSTDVGPVINNHAKVQLQEQIASLRQHAKLIYECTIPASLTKYNYVAPLAFEIRDLTTLTQEVFGPVLHVVRYSADNLEKVVEQINDSMYGLTLGIHSRITTTVEFVKQNANVGNIYVNRDMIGAVVGVQPFGGEGLSGTGPKAGGPDYLKHFVRERVVSINTASIGGNIQLLSLS